MTNDPMQPGEARPAVQSLDYASPQTDLKTRTLVVWVIVASLIIGLLLVFVLLPALGRARGRTRYSPQTSCVVNMHSLVTGLFLYAHDHAGAIPIRLDDLAGNYISPNGLSQLRICPESKAAHIYLGNGMNLNTISKNTVLIFEPLGNHSRKSVNIAFADGRVVLYDEVDAAKLIAELQAGHNPPRAEKLK